MGESSPWPMAGAVEKMKMVKFDLSKLGLGIHFIAPIALDHE